MRQLDGSWFNVLSDDHSHSDKQDRHRLVLEGYSYRWFPAGGLDYMLRRTEIVEPLVW